ncbi:MAG: type VI secretion system Vgr family protein [Desulfovibrionaceae bacterium]
MLQAQETRFTFTSKAYPHTKFSVVSFKGTEGLSTCYRFTIILATDDFNLDLRAVLDSPATFSIRRREDDVPGREFTEIPYHGYIMKFEELQSKGDLCFYRAHLVPRFWWLSLTRRNQIMLDKNLTEAIEIVLKDGGVTVYDYKLALREQYPMREYICQYEETHMNFVSRWMEWAGMYYYFEQGEDAEVLVITDSAIAHGPMPHGEDMVDAPPSGLDTPFLEEIVSQFYCRRFGAGCAVEPCRAYATPPSLGRRNGFTSRRRYGSAAFSDNRLPFCIGICR